MSPKDYRAKAEECRQIAEKAFSPLDKEAWLRLSADWLKMASIREQSGLRSLMSLEFEYRQMAAACLDLVKRAAAPADKTRLLLIAEAWLKLADRVRRKAGNAKRRNGDRAEYPAEYRQSRAP